MNKIIRKLTTKPVWWLETRRSYPVRDAWRQLPPIMAQKGTIPFVVLTTPCHFNDALWTAWSWLRFMSDVVRLEIYVDGPLTDDMRRNLDQILPGSGLFEAKEAIMDMGGFPRNVESFILKHPMGRKLGLYFLRQVQGKFLYSDSDILAFARPSDLLQALATPQQGAYFCEEAGGNYADEIVARARQHGITPVDSLNAGLLAILPNSLSLDLAEEFLRDWSSSPQSWFLEQTVMACLLSASSMTPLSRTHYVIRESRQFYWQQDVDYSKIVARHFTGPTRHVMYLKAMPWILWSFPRSKSCGRVSLRLDPFRDKPEVVPP